MATAKKTKQSEPEVEQGEVEVIDPPAVVGALEVRERGTAIVARDEISVTDLLEQHAKVAEAMNAAMTDGHHYGTIPGVSKPTLLKPGAEKLLVLFRLSPHYASDKVWHDDGHLTVSVVCELRHIPTGLTVATGEGLCTTRETRYRYRKSERVCPACGVPAIIKGKQEYGGGWVCFKRKDGCGVKYADGDPAIESQDTGRIENPDLADSYNTVLKMADKRALVAAILNGTAASDVFTQDVEDAPRAAAPAAKPVDWTTLDPGEQLHPDAPAGWKDVDEVLRAVDPSREWKQVVAAIFAAVYDASSVADLGERSQDAGRRLANFAGYLRDVVTEGRDFPPPSDEQVVAAVAWAFGGVVVELPPAVVEGEVVEGEELSEAALLELDLEALAAASEDIPFGEEQV